MTTDRRKYFRIQDVALVKYRIVQNDMVEGERRSVYRNQIKLESVRAALFGLETHLQDIFETIRRSDPPLVEALQLIDRKINLLERVVSLDNAPHDVDEHDEHEPKQISLSGGGLAIMADRPLAVGAHLAIDLVLLPDNDPMRVFGQVVDSRADDSGQYNISIVFEDIREEDRDRLVQHVVRRQSETLRAERQASA